MSKQSKLDHEFLTQCAFGSLEGVRRSLKNGADINARDARKNTGLILSASIYSQEFASAEICLYLLKKGADWRLVNKDGVRALHFAADTGKASVALDLIERGDAPDRTKKNRQTPLIRAAANGHRSVVDVLLANGADPNRAGRDEQTPLHVATCPEVVARLLEARAKVDLIDKRRRTALHAAASFGQVEHARALIAQGANINARAKSRCTPLWLAAKNNKFSMVAALLEAGADRQARAGRGKSLEDLARTNPSLNQVFRAFDARAAALGAAPDPVKMSHPTQTQPKPHPQPRV